MSTLSSDELNRRLDLIESDYKKLRETRHDANARVYEVLNEERIERMELEKTVDKLALSVQRLVDAMNGGELGQEGVMAQLKQLRLDVSELKQMRDRGQGMLTLVAWLGAGLGALATMRSFIK